MKKNIILAVLGIIIIIICYFVGTQYIGVTQEFLGGVTNSEETKTYVLKEYIAKNIPNTILPEQLGDTFKIGSNLFQIIEQPTSQNPLISPSGKTIGTGEITFVGVLSSKNNGETWESLYKLSKAKTKDGYNVTLLFNKDNNSYIDLVDTNGTGNFNGTLQRMKFNIEKGKYESDGCYLYSPSKEIIEQEGVYLPYNITKKTGCR